MPGHTNNAAMNEATKWKADYGILADDYKQLQIDNEHLKRELHDINILVWRARKDEEIVEADESGMKYKEECEHLRRLLFLRHGCGFDALYGDDGEMQCRECGIDFKQMSAEEISKKFQADGIANIARAISVDKENERLKTELAALTKRAEDAEREVKVMKRAIVILNDWRLGFDCKLINCCELNIDDCDCLRAAEQMARKEIEP